MNIFEETKFIMKKYGITANKRLGQNFLISDDVVNSIIDEAGIRGRERKEYVDMIAAQVILQDYLDNSKDKAE